MTKVLSKSFLGLVGLAALTGMALDWAVVPQEAEARLCLFGGKKCRQKKADKLAAKGQAACEKDSQSKKCLRLNKRLGKVLNRGNMKSYANNQKEAYCTRTAGADKNSAQFKMCMSTTTRDMMSNVMIQNRLLKQCEMAGIAPNSADCLARIRKVNGFANTTTNTNTQTVNPNQNINSHSNTIANGVQNGPGT